MIGRSYRLQLYIWVVSNMFLSCVYIITSYTSTWQPHSHKQLLMKQITNLMVLVKVSGLWGTSAALAEGIPTDPPKPGILRASHHQIPHRPMASLHDIWPLETQYMNSIALIWIHIISHTWTLSEHFTLGSLLLHQLRPNAHQGHFSPTPRVLPCWRNGTRLARSGFRKDTLGAVGVGSQNQKLDIFWELGGWPPFFPVFFWGLGGGGSSDCWYMLALKRGEYDIFLPFFCFWN